jgi:UrcA family protein
MRKQIVTKSALFAALLAGAAVLATAPAAAQAYSGGPNESVTVIAPHFRAQTAPLNAPLEKLSYSLPVHYTFRDLVVPARTRALRGRVWQTAQEVCGRLVEAYPVYTSTSAEPCFREAYNDAMAKIDARAAGARIAYHHGYGY